MTMRVDEKNINDNDSNRLRQFTNHVPDELSNIIQWSSTNNLKLNPNKSYEMIVHLTGKKPTCIPPHG